MSRGLLLRLALVAIVACFVSKTLALDASEITALSDFYTANRAALASLTPAWGSDPTNVCNSTTPWQGITCKDNHVTALILSRISLGGSIPDSIGGLSYAIAITLSGCGLTGSIPPSLADITTLSETLDLSSNSLSLCATDPLVLPSSTVSCSLASQQTTICVNNTCCGCASAWASSSCTVSAIAVCANCTGAVPPEYPTATCSNGYYIIPKSHTGGLTVNGKVAVMGDLSIPAGEALIMVGFSSFLNVTGSMTMKSYGIVIAATEANRNELKTLGRYTPRTYTYMYVGNPIKRAGSFSGSNSLVAVHTEKGCKPTATSSSASTDYTNWTVKMYYTSSCNTWWIVVVCFTPFYLVFIVGFISVIGERVAKCG